MGYRLQITLLLAHIGRDFFQLWKEAASLKRRNRRTASLTPQKFRGQRCEPAHVRHTAETIAGARGLAFDELAASTTELAREFFGI